MFSNLLIRKICIYLPRNPLECLPSFCSVVAHAQGMHSDIIDTKVGRLLSWLCCWSWTQIQRTHRLYMIWLFAVKGIGSQWLHKQRRCTQRAIKARSQWKMEENDDLQDEFIAETKRIIDLSYSLLGSKLFMVTAHCTWIRNNVKNLTLLLSDEMLACIAASEYQKSVRLSWTSIHTFSRGTHFSIYILQRFGMLFGDNSQNMSIWTGWIEDVAMARFKSSEQAG